MKTSLAITIALCFFFSGLVAQTDTINYVRVQSSIFRTHTPMEWSSAPAANLDCLTGVALIESDSLQNGYNLLATNTVNRRKVYLIASRTDQQLSIVGFVLQHWNGKLTHLDPSSIMTTHPAGQDAAMPDSPCRSFTHSSEGLQVSCTQFESDQLIDPLPAYEF